MPLVQTNDGINLFYHDWGTGEPVLFVHGWVLGGDCWEYQMTELANAGLRCIAHDRRGCGRSDQPWDGYDMDTLADDLSQLIEHLDLRGATLVAHSMGAGEVTRYLSRHGTDRVARIVLVAPTTPFLLKTADNPFGLERAFFDNFIVGLEKDRPQALTLAAPTFFGSGSSVSQESVEWGIRLALRASLRATVALFRANAVTDYRPEMAAYTVPTLILHGDADQLAPLDVTGRRTAEAIPGSRLETYEGGGHGIFLTEKDRVTVGVRAFISSAGGDGVAGATAASH
jgi:non-heme chloroperoxidase